MDAPQSAAAYLANIALSVLAPPSPHARDLARVTLWWAYCAARDGNDAAAEMFTADALAQLRALRGVR